MRQRPLLCVTVTGQTTADLRRNRDAVRDADLVELRLDSVRDPDVAGALHGRTCPVILTCRPAREGGWFHGSEEERRGILRAAIDSDAEYVDLEWLSGLDDLLRRRQGRGTILSTHDHHGVPADLVDRALEMARGGAEVVKIATQARALADTVAMLDVSRRLQDRRRVLVSMGEAGLVTRVLASRFGSAWSYAGAAVAPGQQSPEAMRREFTFDRVGPDTALYGVVGRPVTQSLSPAMHNAAFQELGVDAVYVPLPAVDLADLAVFASAFGLAGASVTAPFKVDALGLVDEIDETARSIGAVNTLAWRVDGRVAGTNTDAEGFLEPLAGVPLAGRRVAVLGAGGAARAVASALLRRHARVTLHGRTGERVARAAAETGADAGGPDVPPRSWDMLVNATPVGAWPDVGRTPLPDASFDGDLVYDLVYTPIETRLMREAAAAGCRTIGGLAMLVAQARLQQRFWLGRVPRTETLRRAAEWKMSIQGE